MWNVVMQTIRNYIAKYHPNGWSYTLFGPSYGGPDRLVLASYNIGTLVAKGLTC